MLLSSLENMLVPHAYEEGLRHSHGCTRKYTRLSEVRLKFLHSTLAFLVPLGISDKYRMLPTTCKGS